MEQSTRFRNFLRTLLATSGLVVLFFSPNAAQSQGYHLGLQLAPNVSMAEPRELSHAAIQSEAHFGYGFVFDAMFTEKYAIGTGVNVFYNGGITQHLAFQEDENGLSIEAVQLVQQQQYVEIPLTFKMRTNEIGYTTYFGQFGAGFGLNVRSEGSQKTTSFATLDSLGSVTEVVFSQSALEAAEGEKVSMADRTRLFRPSMIIGLGAERRLTGSTALVFALRYNVGLRSQYEDFGVLQSQAAESLVYEFDSATGEELPVPIQMQGKTGQIELCFGLMF
jgi:hypothetical protein